MIMEDIMAWGSLGRLFCESCGKVCGIVMYWLVARKAACF